MSGLEMEEMSHFIPLFIEYGGSKKEIIIIIINLFTPVSHTDTYRFYSV